MRLTSAILAIAGAWNCQAQDVVRWAPNSPEASQEWHAGILSRTIFHRGVWAVASLERNGRELALRLSVMNEGASPVDLLPSKITALEATGNPLKPIDKVAGAQKAKRWQAIGVALSGASAGLQDVNNTQSTATVTDSNGKTSNVSIQRPNEGRAVEANNRRAAQERAQLDSLEAQYQSVALKAETLRTGQHVSGFVWFSKPKGNLVTVRIPLNGETFEFSFDLSTRP